MEPVEPVKHASQAAAGGGLCHVLRYKVDFRANRKAGSIFGLCHVLRYKASGAADGLHIGCGTAANPPAGRLLRFANRFWAIAAPAGFCLLAMLMLGGCGRRDTRFRRDSRTVLHLGNGSEPRISIRTCRVVQRFQIVVALFEGLAAIDETTSRPIPAVAERWETSATPGLAVLSEDRRPVEQWRSPDGSRFRVRFHRALSPNLRPSMPTRSSRSGTRGLNAGQLADFSQVGVRARDDHTLEIVSRSRRLLAPPPRCPPGFRHTGFNEKLGALTIQACVDASWEHGLQRSVPAEGMVSGQRVVVDRNPEYWDASHVRLHRIVFYPLRTHRRRRPFPRRAAAPESDVPLSKIVTYRRDNPSVLRIDPFMDTHSCASMSAEAVLRPSRAPGWPALSTARRSSATSRLAANNRRIADSAGHPATPAGRNSRRFFRRPGTARRRRLRRGPRLSSHRNPVRDTRAEPAPAGKPLQQMWRRELGIEVVSQTRSSVYGSMTSAS